MITIFSACGTGESSAQTATLTKPSGITLGTSSTWGGFSWETAKGVNQGFFNPIQIPYPAKGFGAGMPTTYLQSVGQGVALGAGMIQQLNDKFILVGYSQGAQVISELYQQLKSGSLKAYWPKFVAGVTFGNPMRQQGHSWPGDPTHCTGRGINGNGLLTNTPVNWWDFTNVYDLAGNVPADGAGGLITEIWNVAGFILPNSTQSATASIKQLASDQTLAQVVSEAIYLPEAAEFLVNAVVNIGTTGHEGFNTAHLGTTGLTAVQTAINYINTFAA